MTVAMAANASGPATRPATSARSQPRRRSTGPGRPRSRSPTPTAPSTAGPQPGDTVVITFSEPLAPASVPASTTVTLTDPVGTGNDTLTMAGVSNGARAMGSNNYVTADATVASFANSTVALSNANRTITVTIGSIVHRHRVCRTRTAGRECDLLIRRRNHAHRRRRQPRRHRGQDPEHPPLLTSRCRRTAAIDFERAGAAGSESRTA